MEIPKLTTPTHFSEEHPDFPIGGIRHLIFHENENGLAESAAIIRVGRKILIDETRFFNWVVHGKE